VLQPTPTCFARHSQIREIDLRAIPGPPRGHLDGGAVGRQPLGVFVVARQPLEDVLVGGDAPTKKCSHLRAPHQAVVLVEPRNHMFR
jgi:hypothetical protein